VGSSPDRCTGRTSTGRPATRSNVEHLDAPLRQRLPQRGAIGVTRGPGPYPTTIAWSTCCRAVTAGVMPGQGLDGTAVDITAVDVAAVDVTAVGQVTAYLEDDPLGPHAEHHDAVGGVEAEQIGSTARTSAGVRSVVAVIPAA